jgi:hypothetical protein
MSAAIAITHVVAVTDKATDIPLLIVGVAVGYRRLRDDGELSYVKSL